MSCFGCFGGGATHRPEVNGGDYISPLPERNGNYQKFNNALSKPQLKPQPIDVPQISANELREVTDNYGSKALIGEGSYGRVYYGVLKNGRRAAIKKLDASKQEDDEFLAQVSMVSRLKHENFIELLGYCVEGNLRILAFEFASNGSLHDVLHGKLVMWSMESFITLIGGVWLLAFGFSVGF